MSSGNPYDEYVDEDSYFVLNVQSAQLQKFSLKKKSIKEAFASEAEKLNKFFLESRNEAMNDVFLKSFGDYINN